MTALGRDATSNLLSSAPETGRSSFASRKLPDAIECSRPRPDGRRNEGAMTPSQAKPPFERQVCRMAERGPLADGIRLGNLGQKQRASSQGEAAGCSAMMAMPTSATPAPAISQRVSAMPSMMRNHSSATAMYMPP